MEMENQEKNTISRSFTVSDMPLHVWKDFKEYAENDAGDCYWMAIKTLLDNVKLDYKTQMVLNLVAELKRDIDDIKVSLATREPEGDAKVKTFGGEAE